jgi:hypothetical protein
MRHDQNREREIMQWLKRTAPHDSPTFYVESRWWIQDLQDALKEEIAAREATHQLAAYYELLLVRLQGEPTDHGDCPVAKYIDKLEIRIAHLTSTVTTLRAKRAAEAAMEGD